MSYYISGKPNLSFFSKGAKDFFDTNYSHFMASETLISELPLKNSKIEPVYMPTKSHGECLDAIVNLDIQSDDVIVCALPKCGSTWMTTISWLLTHNLDFGTIESSPREKLLSNFDDFATANAAKQRAQELLSSDDSESLSDSAALTFACKTQAKTL